MPVSCGVILQSVTGAAGIQALGHPLGGRRASERLALGALAGLVVVIALAVVADGKPARGTRPATGGQHECPPVHGPQWAFPSKTLKASSDLYESFATGVPCTEAALWTRRLAAKRVAAVIGSASSLQGPHGFTCYGYPDLAGHAYVGSCVKGSAIFGWNFNEMTTPAYTEPGLPKTLGGASDVQEALMDLGHGRYRLTVRNISPKGIIDGFAWMPQGITIDAVTSTRGGTCKASNGGISCTGHLHQPGCLCDASGGALTIEFTARVTSGGSAIPAVEARTLHITSITPVPHLVPSTKQGQHSGNT
jgi:hypothetical protein